LAEVKLINYFGGNEKLLYNNWLIICKW